jgi:hypothetical protein
MSPKLSIGRVQGRRPHMSPKLSIGRVQGRRPHMTLSGPYSANKDDRDDHSNPTWGKENMSRLSNR